MKALSLLVLLALAPFAVLRADTVHLKSGGTVDGSIVEKNDKSVTIKTKFGVQTISMADVAKIEAKAAPEEEFKKRRGSVAANDAKALFDLYLWAKSEGLKNQATQVLRDILKIDPDHENARTLLGYVKFDGKWVSEKEKQKLEADSVRAEKEKQGLVEYKGEWMTPAEKEAKEHADNGEILVDGSWVKKEDVERAKRDAERRAEAEKHRANGEFEVDGKWVARDEAERYYQDIGHPYRAEGDHVIVYTNKGIDFGDKMLVSAEAAYRAAAAFFGAEPSPAGKKLHVYVVASLDDYKALGNQWGDEKSSNFYAFSSPWLTDPALSFDMVSVTMYNLADTLTGIYTSHATAEQFVLRMLGSAATDTPPTWFVDGVASYIERWQGPSTQEPASWSRDRLRSQGWLLKLKTFFGSYPKTEQSILQAGLLVRFLADASCPEEVKTEFKGALEAFKKGAKISKAFRLLEKALLKHEDAIADFAER